MPALCSVLVMMLSGLNELVAPGWLPFDCSAARSWLNGFVGLALEVAALELLLESLSEPAA